MLNALRRAVHPLWSFRGLLGEARPADSDRAPPHLHDAPTSLQECNVPAPDVATKTDLFYCFRLLLQGEREWRDHQQRWVGQPLTEVVTLYLQSMEFANRRLLRPPLPDLQVVDLARFQMYVAPTDLAVGRDILALRTYEPAVTRAVERVLRPGMAFVDVGANVGYFSLLAALLVGPMGGVFAFEPSETNVKVLHLSGVLNGFRNLQVFPIAAGPEWGLSFYNSSHSNGWVTPIAATPEDVLGRTVVLSAPISQVLPPDRRVDMLKIDIEGGEFVALTGAKPTIERYHPVIVSEFSPPALEAISHVSGPDYLGFLTGLGYRISVLREDAPVACGTDIERVMACFHESGVDHIDILAE